MNTRKRKFLLINEAIKILNNEKKAICLISHVNNMNIQQTNNLKVYCNSKNIRMFSLKLNLLHKLTINPLFLNICAGPTKLFFFDSPTSFLNFVEEESVKDKIIPLGVYYQNQFFSYNAFEKKLKTFFGEKFVDLSNYNVQFLLSFSKKSDNLLCQLPTTFNNFLRLLNKIKSEKN